MTSKGKGGKKRGTRVTLSRLSAKLVARLLVGHCRAGLLVERRGTEQRFESSTSISNRTRDRQEVTQSHLLLNTTPSSHIVIITYQLLLLVTRRPS